MSQWVSKQVAHLHIGVYVETCFHASRSFDWRTLARENFCELDLYQNVSLGLQTNDLKC